MGDDHAWAVPGNLTIYDVQGYEQQCPLLKTPELRWQLSLQATREMDSAGVQWLLSLLHRVEASGGALQLTDVGKDLVSIFTLMGVTQTLPLKMNFATE